MILYIVILLERDCSQRGLLRSFPAEQPHNSARRCRAVVAVSFIVSTESLRGEPVATRATELITWSSDHSGGCSATIRTKLNNHWSYYPFLQSGLLCQHGGMMRCALVWVICRCDTVSEDNVVLFRGAAEDGYPFLSEEECPLVPTLWHVWSRQPPGFASPLIDWCLLCLALVFIHLFVCLLFIHLLLFIIYYLLFTIYYLLFTIYYLSIYYFLFIIYFYWLYIIHYSLFIIYIFIYLNLFI